MILFQAALAFLAGVSLAALGSSDWWPAATLGGAGVCFGALLARRMREAATFGVLLLLVLVGVDRYEESLPASQPQGIALLNDRDTPVILRGVIVDEPEEGDRTQRFTLRVDEADAGAGFQAADGRVLVVTRLFPAYDYGAVLELTAHLETPPRLDSFDYREYLARRGVHSQALFPEQARVIGADAGSDLTGLLIETRRPLGEALERALPEPESALARGILLGQRAAIPPDLSDDLNRAGISHLVAISGQNVAIVAGVLVASLSWWLGRRPATAVAIALVLLYAVFVGASPSVMRAALMATVMLGATLAGRPGSALGAVALTAAILVAWRPLIVDDVSFQLSFAATLGIVLAAKRIQDILEPRLSRLPGWLGVFLTENAAITTAASLAVLPVIAGSFGRLSIVSLPANLLAAPVFVLALGASFLAAIAGTIHEELGLLVGQIAYLPLTYLVRLGRFAADLPLASVELEGFGFSEVFLTYGLLALAWLVLRSRPLPDIETARPRPLRPAIAISAALAVAALLIWGSVLRPQDGRLQVTVLDVGQGDAILIETPAGHRILVDGGPSGARITQALGRVLPPSVRSIDLLVLTHAQEDHVAGLVEVLQRYDVGAVLAGLLLGKTAVYRAWLDEIERTGVPTSTAEAGQTMELGGGAFFEVLAPASRLLTGTEDDLNNNSVVLRLVYGQVSFLLTGDLAAEGEIALLETPFDLRATVLKVGHHGSDGSTKAAFLNAVSPAVAVISAGAENTFGHPSPTTRLRLAGVPMLRTDENGDVRFETDGASLWIDAAHGGYSIVPLGVAR